MASGKVESSNEQRYEMTNNYVTQEEFRKLEDRVEDLERVEDVDDLEGLETVQFEEKHARKIMEWAVKNRYGFEPVAFGILIFDQYDAVDVKRYADEKGISYRGVEIVDPMVHPEEAARIKAKCLE